jgi:very-short-patch-repair endonuclease
MPRFVQVVCVWCGKTVIKPEKEYVRQIRDRGKNVNWFCNRTCSVNFGNSLRSDLRVKVEKVCPYCTKTFSTMSGHNSATYCSKSCASSASVTDLRRESARKMGKINGKLNLVSSIEVIALGLKTREAWKYKDLKEYLEAHKVSFEFEYVVGAYIFDLALPDIKTIIEFDGHEHNGLQQIEKDKKRDEFAISNGWIVKRIEVSPRTVIHPRVLYGII